MSPGALERLQLQLQRATLSSPVASPIWLESSPEKCEKIAQMTRLPGAITFPYELRFMKTLYRWKVDIWGFPTICCMTHFEYQKASKITSKNQVRKWYTCENRGRFGGGAAWRIRLPRDELYNSCAMVTRRAPWSSARRAAPPI